MEHLKDIKRALTAKVEAQMGNLEHVDTHELGEAIDMIKDLADAMYHCSIVDAMEKGEEERKNGNTETYYYTERFLPPYYYDDYRMGPREMEKMYYGDDNRGSGTRSYGNGVRGYGDGRRYADENPRDMGGRDRRGYYDEHMYNMPTRDSREGRSGTSRRNYMEAKEMHQEKEDQLKELEHYMQELGQDVTEMIQDASPEEKTLLHKKLTSLANKIEVLSK